MKKLFALLMAILMIFSMAACASLGFGDGDDISWEEDDDRDDDKDKDDEDDKDNEDKKDDDGENEDVNNNGNGNNNAGENGGGENKPSGGNTQVSDAYTVYDSLNNTVIMDNEYITVTMKEMNTDRWGNTAIDIQVKNNTSESITFNLDKTALNGRMSSGYCNCTVEAGETADAVIELYEKDIKRISMQLCVVDSDWDILTTELVDVYPEGRDAYVHKVPDTSKAVESLVESNYSLSFTGYENDEYGCSALYVAVNDTDKLMDFEVYLNSINGLYVNYQDYCKLLPNTYLEDNIWIDLEEMDIYGIKNVTMLDVQYIIYEETNADGYSKLNEKTCVLYPKGQNNVEKFAYVSDANDVAIYDQNGIKLIFTENYIDSDGDMQLVFYFENGTGSELSCDCQIIEINGVNTEDSYFDIWTSVPSNMPTFAMEYLWEDELEGYNIKEISTMKLQVSISKQGSFVTNVVDETIEITIP